MKALALIIAAVLAFSSASIHIAAQDEFPGFLPSECELAAIETLLEANDVVFEAVYNADTTVQVEFFELNVAMSLEDGTAPLWLYIVPSEELDTTALIPMTKGFGECQVFEAEGLERLLAQIEIGGDALPQQYIEREQFISLLETNPLYTDFRATFPDSSASYVAQ